LLDPDPKREAVFSFNLLEDIVYPPTLSRVVRELSSNDADCGHYYDCRARELTTSERRTQNKLIIRVHFKRPYLSLHTDMIPLIKYVDSASLATGLPDL
jgi:hypothetical protein